MINKYFRNIFPKTFYGRILLIVWLPCTLMVSVSTYVFAMRYNDKVKSVLASHVAQAFLYGVEHIDQSDRMEQAAIQSYFDVHMTWHPWVQLPASRTDNIYLANALEKVGIYHYNIQKSGDHFCIQVLTRSGVLEVKLPYHTLYLRTADIFLMWHWGSLVLFASIAWVLTRNQIRPLHDLAHLADSLGKGESPHGVRIRGAREIRKVGMAFLGMRDRINRMLTERTHMLAAISHDLKTPLTRIRLGLGLPYSPQEAEKLLHDVDDMKRMIDGYLAFTKGSKIEAPQWIDIHDLLKPWSQDPRVIQQTIPHVRCYVQHMGLRRCLQNVIDNALRFSSRVWLKIKPRSQGFWILIDDEGPGIPPSQREDVLKPFYRGDASRNQNLPGTGLGLSIVADIVYAHGGKLFLRRAPQGGLRVMIQIPWTSRHGDDECGV